MEVYLASDQPTTCPKCGGRTNFTESDSTQYNVCVYCGYQFEVSSDEDKDDHYIETNVDIVNHIMTRSRYGALSQVFVIEALTRYAKQVSEAPVSALNAHPLLSGEAWHGVAVEIQDKLNAKYGRTS